MTHDPSLEDTIQLVVRARDGDRTALESLFDRYLPRVRRIAALKLGTSSRQMLEVDDVVQEALADAFRNLGSFRVESDGRFCAWLAKIVQNRILMSQRSQAALKRDANRVQRFADSESTQVADALLPPGGDPTPSQHMIGRELEDRIESAILAMSPRYREVLVHRYFCQLSFQEIADEMAMASDDAVRSLYSKALKELRSRLA